MNASVDMLRYMYTITIISFTTLAVLGCIIVIIKQPSPDSVLWSQLILKMITMLWMPTPMYKR